MIALGVIVLAAAYLLPLWRIELQAPQYPEPIGMLIHVNTIRGIGENDLENINILNHYIGMRAIEPESIPELRFMPWILAGLIVLGIVALLYPRRWLIGFWVAALITSGAVGLYDFNQWEVDYGTNLNPTAPIKIEGMTYKPPLIGTEQLLNITAHSYPSWGGYAVVVAILLGIAAIYCSSQKAGRLCKSSDQKSTAASAFAKASMSLALWLLVSTGLSCSPSPEPIRYGSDECTVCKMIISDQRFGAEIVSTTGKVYKFDSIECMVNHLLRQRQQDGTVALTLVVNFFSPGTLMDAHNAHYLRSENLPSPMGADLSAYSSEAEVQRARSQYGGSVLSWEEVERYIASLD